MKCTVQIYIARLQQFSDALTAKNKNVFSFVAKVQFNSSTFAVQAADCFTHMGQPLQSSWRRWQYESVERTGFWCQRTAADVDQPRMTHGRSEVGRCQAMEALENNQRQLEPHTLYHGQPMEFVQH